MQDDWEPGLYAPSVVVHIDGIGMDGWCMYVGDDFIVFDGFV